MNKSIWHVLTKRYKSSPAFTIVELLVVIVVIGILAAITIVSYSGIREKATTSSIKAQLKEDSKMLKMYYVDHGVYPSTLDSNYCPITPESDSKYCLKNMSGAALSYSGSNYSFTLTITSGSISYRITETGAIALVSGSSAGSFVKAWGGTLYDSALSMTQALDGGYVIAGETDSYDGTGYGDAYLAKYDSSGNLSWNKTWGGTDNDYVESIIQTSDGGYVAAGVTYSYGAGGRDAFLAKYDSLGNLSWNKTWGGTDNDYVESIIQTNDGGYAVAGNTSSYGAGIRDAFLAKYDSSGNLSWSKTWGGTNNDDAESIIQTSDGGYAIAGVTSSYGAGGRDAFLAKYDSSGNLSWSKTWGGTNNEDTYSIIQTTDGSYVMAGDTFSYGIGNGFGDAFLAKYDSSGNLSWSKTWGGTNNDYVRSIIQTTDGGYAMAGDTLSYGAGSMDTYLAKYDSSGNLSWSKTWGGTNNVDRLHLTGQNF